MQYLCEVNLGFVKLGFNFFRKFFKIFQFFEQFQSMIKRFERFDGARCLVEATLKYRLTFQKFKSYQMLHSRSVTCHNNANIRTWLHSFVLQFHFKVLVGVAERRLVINFPNLFEQLVDGLRSNRRVFFVHQILNTD